MKYAVEMGSGGKIYIRSFMKIGTSVQEILRFSLSNLSGCNVGITDGRRIMKCTVENSTGSLIVYYTRFRNINFPCILPCSFPVPQINE
jgi:hypothetical protein